MLTKLFDSLSFNIKQKTTNPFLGTLLIVWIFRNWDLVYGLFYFDGDMKLQDRLDWILAYYPHWYTFYLDLLWAVVESFLILVLTYLFLNASRFIVNIYENRVSPWITKHTNPKGIIELDKYQKLEARTTRLEVKASEERRKRIEAESEIDRLEIELKQLKNESFTSLVESDLDPSVKYRDAEEAGARAAEYDLKQWEKEEKSELAELIEKLKEKDLLEPMSSIIEDILVGSPIWIGSDSTKRIATLGLIERTSEKTLDPDRRFFKLTDMGIKVKNYLVQSKEI